MLVGPPNNVGNPQPKKTRFKTHHLSSLSFGRSGLGNSICRSTRSRWIDTLKMNNQFGSEIWWNPPFLTKAVWKWIVFWRSVPYRLWLRKYVDHHYEGCANSKIHQCQLLWSHLRVLKTPCCFFQCFCSFFVFLGDSGSKETPGQHVQSYLPFCWQPRWWGELNGSKRSVARWL